MKKRIACLLTALVVLSCATPVFAAQTTGAVSPGSAQPEIEASVTAADGTVLNVTIKNVDEAVKNEAVAEAAKVAADADVVSVVDVKLGSAMPAGGVVLTLNVDGVKAGDYVVLLHEKADGTWETIIPYAVMDGAVVAHFTSLSPVAIVKLPAAAYTAPVAPTTPAAPAAPVAPEAPTTPAAPVAPEAPTAPKAGASLVLPLAALVCAAGATVCGRKVK